ncbi:uncharacterized protein LOC105203822 [Solenopsis invicta]|uniref:uncharacterized protein LOC105203822 n=1 Tax=Solenopsis invicta TaxID=13686 RepID=UPI0005961B20|nr:uncharacterized protein LOC105203822 [Solenopsis invicta]
MFALFFAFVFVTAAYAANDIPFYIRLCGRNSPNDVYGQCIKDNINNVKNTICSQGLPEFNVSPLEPIIIDKIVVYDRDSLKLIVTDAKVRDFCDLDITFINVHGDKLRFEAGALIKHITVDATYDFDIQLLVSLAHKGLIHVTTDDLGVKLEVQLKEVTKNNKTQMYISKTKSQIDITKYTFQFDDEKEGLGQLHDILTKTINDNAKEIINKIKPSLELALSKTFMSVYNKVIYNRFEQLFPDEV